MQPVDERCYIDRNKTQRIVMIGAGPTALGAAYRLYELGVLASNTQVVILEQEDGPGGTASSYRDSNGFLWDNGGHVVFSHYPYFETVLNKSVQEWNKHSRASYAFMMGSSGKRRFIPYPVQHNIHVMDTEEQETSIKGLEQIVKHPTNSNPKTFDDWLLRNFGEGLCEVFMRKYNRKVWTVDPTEMNSIWVGAYVAVPKVNEIKDKIAKAKKDDTKAKDSEWGLNHSFKFPRYGGTGAVWKGVASLLPQGWFHFHKKVIAVNTQSKSLHVQVANAPETQYTLKYDYLISTIPIDLLLQMLTGNDTNLAEMKSIGTKFVYSHTHVVGIGLKGQPPEFLANKSWMYFPDSDSPFYRVTVFSNYADDNVPDPGKVWSLMCEAAEPKYGGDLAYWHKEQLTGNTITALLNYGFIQREQVLSTYHHRLEHGYPVPFLKRERLLATIQPWLESKGIYSRGRFGGWRYEVSSQDHSVMQGLEVVDFIMFGIPEETYPHPNLVNSMKSSDRTLHCQQPPKSLPDYEFVIAHYKENLTWALPYADHCHVYHKGGQRNPQLQFKLWETLPNVGREGHTYLHHIIHNYHCLANVTVFLQADFGHNVVVEYRNQFDYITKSKTKQFSTKLMSKLSDWGKIHWVGKWARMMKRGEIRLAKQTLGDFWQTIFGTQHPRVITATRGGVFGVTRQRIHSHPREFYEKLIVYVSDHPNPEEGHYLERLWPSIFGF